MIQQNKYNQEIEAATDTTTGSTSTASRTTLSIDPSTSIETTTIDSSASASGDNSTTIKNEMDTNV
jgi:hypothetical protein